MILNSPVLAVVGVLVNQLRLLFKKKNCNDHVNFLFFNASFFPPKQINNQTFIDNISG